jgi:hypothetical protein
MIEALWSWINVTDFSSGWVSPTGATDGKLRYAEGVWQHMSQADIDEAMEYL